jgi:Na+/H+-translocating membrane pyrophosphatase
MAISAANTGGAWDNAKKYIESGAMFDVDGNRVLKGS